MTHRAPHTEGQLRQVLRYARLPAAPLAAASLLLLLDAAISLLTPLIVGLATAHILGQEGLLQVSLRQLLWAWAALILVQATLRYTSTQKLGKAAASLGAGLRQRIYQHIQALPLGFFHDREHGDILSLLSEDIRRISHLLTESATQIAPHLITVTGAAIIVTGIDPLTGLAAMCIVPLVLLAIRLSGRAAKPLSRVLADRQAAHTSLTEENLRLNPLIKAFTREQLELDRYDNSNRQLLEAEVQHLRISNRIGPIVQAITGIAVVGLVWIGALRIQTGSLQAAELVSLILYGFILFRPLLALGTTYGAFQSARGAAGRLSELLEEQAESSDSGTTPFLPPSREIRIENMQFAYPGRPATLNALSATIPAGKVTALVGENGTGKTTLIHLLLRFFEPDQGTITFDGVNIREFPLRQLRDNIGYVPQHVTLVGGTIEENIRYGLPEATPEALKLAAERALVTEFVDLLPDGLQTLVGPAGVKLSGGQKQRIALARALLKDFPVLFLDEPTSMFDEVGEQAVLHSLTSTHAGKTILLVTHRPAVLAVADNIIELSATNGSPSAQPPQSHS